MEKSDISKDDLNKFIVDVVVAHTPPITTPTTAPGWTSLIFSNPPWENYGLFVGSVLGRRFFRTTRDGAVRNEYESAKSEFDPDDYEYSIITLNDDSVIEQPARDLNARFNHPIDFVQPRVANPERFWPCSDEAPWQC